MGITLFRIVAAVILPVEEICKKVKADVDAFAGEADQFDDITMVSIKLNRFGTDTGGLQNG